MTTEERYTLREAQRELARRQCSAHGHDWDILVTMSGPAVIVCRSCGWSGAVQMDDRSKATPPTELPA